jgi:tetraacyldisaccharide 4'-kinase
LLTPAAGLYAAGIGVRNAAYGAGVLRTGTTSARTVSIGNLRVGGTGKTPLTRWLAQQTQARGVTTAIVSRGYLGSTREPHVVGDGTNVVSDVARSGDEAVMLARTSGVPVVAGTDRVAAAALAVTTFASRLLLCDDAFQHRALRRDLDVVLVDAGERGGLGRLLPAGPLREPLRALRRAHVVLVREREGVAASAPPGALRVRFAPRALVQPVATGWEEIGLAALAGQRVLAVSGVARPAPLYRTLRDWEAELVHVLEYPDHHAYDARDWHAIAAAAKDVDLIVTTEKDLVKLESYPFARGKLVALRLGVTIESAEELVARVIGAAASGAA